jgi:GDP-4-dehydro-6-deoxy-D-mannose reductase
MVREVAAGRRTATAAGRRMGRAGKSRPGQLRSVVLIGSSGFIGRHLKERLVRDSNPPSILEFNGRGECGPEFEGLLAKAKPDAIFHMAGVVASSDPKELEEGNVLHLGRMLQAALRQTPHALFIAMGSSAVYGISRSLPLAESSPPAPLTPYGVSMQARSALLELYSRKGLCTIEARLFNVIGPGLSEKTSIGSFLHQAAAIRSGMAPPLLKTGFLGHRRDFIDVRDAAEALVLLANSRIQVRAGPISGRSVHRIFNLCSGHSVPMQEVVEELVRQAAVPIRLETEARRIQKSDMPDNRGDPHLLQKETGWAPRFTLAESLQYGLENTAL